MEKRINCLWIWKCKWDNRNIYIITITSTTYNWLLDSCWPYRRQFPVNNFTVNYYNASLKKFLFKIRLFKIHPRDCPFTVPHHPVVPRFQAWSSWPMRAGFLSLMRATVMSASLAADLSHSSDTCENKQTYINKLYYKNTLPNINGCCFLVPP